MSLTRGAAEELFAAAETAYSEQSYSQAIRLYDEFLEAYPDHEESGLARVRREMARLRQSYKNPEQGMKVAQEVLPQIEQEESFPQAREELASMLPQIAAGFVSAGAAGQRYGRPRGAVGEDRGGHDAGGQPGVHSRRRCGNHRPRRSSRSRRTWRACAGRSTACAT